MFSLKQNKTKPSPQPHPRAASPFSLCIILHALRDPLQISRPWPWTDFLSPNQKCPQRSISAKLLRMSWPAVLLICLSSQASPGIRSCLLRLRESTLENITHGRDGGDLKEEKKNPLQNNKVWLQQVTEGRPHAASSPHKMLHKARGTMLIWYWCLQVTPQVLKCIFCTPLWACIRSHFTQ